MHDFPQGTVSISGALRSPRNLVFGTGQRAALPAYAHALGANIFVVTDARLAATDEFERLMGQLSTNGANVRVFSGVQAELPLECIHEGAEVGRRLGAEVVVGIGGGSCIDAAKAIAVLLTHGGQLSDYYGEFKVPGPIVPVIAIPTSSGTGSEVTPVAVVADPDRALKIGIASPRLIPDTAICDPELTYTCPPTLTAHSGADALTHAIEAFTAARRPWTPQLVHQSVFVGKNGLSDHFALRAIELLAANLKRAYDNGGDRQARASVMLGATLAGLAFGTAGTAGAHALQYPIGAATGTPHGLGVAVMLPYVMAFNRSSCLPEFAMIARAMGVDGSGASDEEASERAIEAVETLFASVGIPRSVAELGLQPQDLEQTVEQAQMARRLVDNNPKPLDTAALSRIVQAALAGDRAHLGHI